MIEVRLPSPPARMQRVLALMRREIRDQSRDWRVVIPMVILTLFFPILMNVTARIVLNFVNQYGSPVIAESIFPFLLMIVGFFPTSVSLVIALESFVGEKERYSIEPLLATPLTDAELFLGKLLAAILTPLLSAFLGIAAYLAGMLIFTGWFPPLWLLGQILLLTAAHAVMMVSAAVVISAQTNSVRAANLLASFIIIPAALLVQGESVVMFWRIYDALWWVILAVALLAVVFIRIGLRQFRREELLAREAEEIRFDRLFLSLLKSFTGGARNPVEWYRMAVLPALRRVMSSSGWVVLALLMALPVGLYLAQQFQLPVGLVRESGYREQFLTATGRMGFQSWPFFVSVVLNNLRALALASLVGVFSLGVLGLIILMLPLVVIVYAAGPMTAAGMPLWAYLAGFVIPHGIVEIPEMVIAGAAILRWGSCLLGRPGGRSVGEVWMEAMADWLIVFLGVVVPMAVLAALIETFITPGISYQVLGWIGW